MGEIRLYRKFYCASINRSTGNESYNLINPYSLSANTFVSGTGNTQSNTIIESGISYASDETGIYYVDLDSQSYASDITYDLVWYVQYISKQIILRKLVTRFKVNPNNIGSGFDVELLGTYALDIEFPQTNTITVEVDNKQIETGSGDNDIETTI